MKFSVVGDIGAEILVVPHAGTWIEIELISNDESERFVVPHAGTWIEISFCPPFVLFRFTVPEIEQNEGLSFPTRERGLK